MDPVFHVIVLALVLLAVKIGPKKVLLLFPVALFPDLDGFLDWAHRLIFHNLIIVMLIPLIISLFVRKKYPKKLNFVYIGWFLQLY
ncbi:MAG: hypothetical protein ACOCSL_00850 [Thermoplasmatota archaeon]